MSALRMSASTQRLGFWSAVLATLFSLTYIVAQFAEWLGWLGSDGGPNSGSTPLGIVVLLTPSLFLGSSFLVLMICVMQAATRERRVWGHIAVAFATAYAVLISIVYYVQLTLVGPRMARGAMEGIEVFRFVPFDSFLYAVDILGYSFMSVATLFAARVFTGEGLQTVARRFLTANGLLLPFLALQMYVHPLIWIASLWAITFPGATWTLALLFRPAGKLRTAQGPNGARTEGAGPEGRRTQTAQGPNVAGPEQRRTRTAQSTEGAAQVEDAGMSGSLA